VKPGRPIRIVAALAAVLLLCGGAGLAWVYTTTAGARFVLARAAAASGGALSVATLEGSLREGLVLGDLRYRDTRHEVEIDRVSLRLGLTTLATGMLVVEDLRSSVVRYRSLGDAAPAAGTRPPFRLPLTVRVDRAAVEGVSIARAEGELALDRIVIAGAAEGTTAYLQRLELRSLGFFLSLQGGVAWDDGFAVDGLVSWSGEIGDDTWLGSADVAGRWPLFAIDQEMLQPVAQTATGTLLLGESPAFDLAITVPELGTVEATGSYAPAARLMLADVSAAGLEPGAVVPGWPGRWNVGGSVRADFGGGLRIASDDLRLEAVLGEQRLAVDAAAVFDQNRTLEIRELVAVLGANRLELSGSIGPTLDLTLAADLDDLEQIGTLASRQEIRALTDSAALATSLSGRATADIAVSGTVAAPLASGSVRLLESRFAGLPLELSLDFAQPAGGAAAIVLDRIEARLGATRVSGAGRFGSGIVDAAGSWRESDAPVSLRLEASADDLAELAALATGPELRSIIGRTLPVAGLEGSLSGNLELAGSPRRPDLAGTLRVRDLGLSRLALSESTLDFSVGLYPGGASRLTLDAVAEAWSARLQAAGSIAAGNWTGTVSALDIREPWLGGWALEAPVDLVAGPGRIEFADACLLHLDSGLCGEWHYGGATDRLTLTARDFELAVLNPLLPPTLTLAGAIAGDASLDVLGGSPVGSLSLDAGEIAIGVAMSETDSVTTTLTSLALDAALDDYALDLAAEIESESLGRAEVSLATADIRNPDAPIGGRLDIAWPDLSVMSLLSPDVGEVGGTLTLGIDVAGSAASPELSGRGVLSGGRIAVPEWGVLIERIEGEALSDEGRILRYRGSGYIEDSEILVSGVTELDPAASWPTQLTLTGDHVPVARRPDATVIASPDFEVDIRLPRIDVSGTVLVPEAELAVEELPSQAVRTSPDSVVHGRAQAAEVRPLQLTALVSVELGDDVRYTGSNLDTALHGGLSIEYESGRSPIAGGSVTLDGVYQAYGQTLTLERGELLFAGPLDDPAIDVLATRSIGATTVGVRVNGTLQSPITSMYSEPAMSEANALSYLMFGRPLRSTADEDTATLEAAAFALGVQQALPAVQRVGESLGLDELSIESTEIDAGSLMAGKYLSPKLYLSYTYGLFNRLGGFLLRYDINDRFSLETRSGNEKAMDLLYSIEKD